MSVTIVASHVANAFARQTPCRFPEIAIRTALRAACRGEDVVGVVVGGGPSSAVDRTPYEDAQRALERCMSALPEDVDPDDAEFDYARRGGSLTWQFVDPPPVVVGNVSRPTPHQEWYAVLQQAFPGMSKTLIDCTGPDVLTAGEIESDDRVIRWQRSAMRRTDREFSHVDHESDEARGFNDMPTVRDVVRAAEHYGHQMKLLSAVMQTDDPLHIADPMSATRRQMPLKCWFLNDWRVMDVPSMHRRRVIQLPRMHPTGKHVNELSFSHAAATGIQEQMRQVWVSDLVDWSILAFGDPLENGTVPIADIGSVNDMQLGSDGARFKVQINQLPAILGSLGSALPPTLLGHVCASHMLRTRVSVDDVAWFLAANLDTRIAGHGEALDRDDACRKRLNSEIGSSLPMEDELPGLEKAAFEDATMGNVFSTLNDLSTRRFVRRRVGLARFPAAEPSLLRDFKAANAIVKRCRWM